MSADWSGTLSGERYLLPSCGDLRYQALPDATPAAANQSDLDRRVIAGLVSQETKALLDDVASTIAELRSDVATVGENLRSEMLASIESFRAEHWEELAVNDTKATCEDFGEHIERMETRQFELQESIVEVRSMLRAEVHDRNAQELELRKQLAEVTSALAAVLTGSEDPVLRTDIQEIQKRLSAHDLEQMRADLVELQDVPTRLRGLEQQVEDTGVKQLQQKSQLDHVLKRLFDLETATKTHADEARFHLLENAFKLLTEEVDGLAANVASLISLKDRVPIHRDNVAEIPMRCAPGSIESLQLQEVEKHQLMLAESVSDLSVRTQQGIDLLRQDFDVRFRELETAVFRSTAVSSVPTRQTGQTCVPNEGIFALDEAVDKSGFPPREETGKGDCLNEAATSQAAATGGATAASLPNAVRIALDPAGSHCDSACLPMDGLMLSARSAMTERAIVRDQ